MRYVTPARLILIGFALLLLGFILPFLMVLQLLESTLLLNFIAYLTSFFGLLAGLSGIVTYARERKKDEDEPE